MTSGGNDEIRYSHGRNKALLERSRHRRNSCFLFFRTELTGRNIDLRSLGSERVLDSLDGLVRIRDADSRDGSVELKRNRTDVLGRREPQERIDGARKASLVVWVSRIAIRSVRAHCRYQVEQARGGHLRVDESSAAGNSGKCRIRPRVVRERPWPINASSSSWETGCSRRLPSLRLPNADEQALLRGALVETDQVDIHDLTENAAGFAGFDSNGDKLAGAA